MTVILNNDSRTIGTFNNKYHELASGHYNLRAPIGGVNISNIRVGIQHYRHGAFGKGHTLNRKNKFTRVTKFGLSCLEPYHSISCCEANFISIYRVK